MVPFPNKDSTKYSKISIPYEMKIEIERIINTDKRLGFVSVQEFVKEAVRGSIIHYGENSSDKSNTSYNCNAHFKQD